MISRVGISNGLKQDNILCCTTACFATAKAVNLSIHSSFTVVYPPSLIQTCSLLVRWKLRLNAKAIIWLTFGGTRLQLDWSLPSQGLAAALSLLPGAQRQSVWFLNRVLVQIIKRELYNNLHGLHYLVKALRAYLTLLKAQAIQQEASKTHQKKVWAAWTDAQ